MRKTFAACLLAMLPASLAMASTPTDSLTAVKRPIELLIIEEDDDEVVGNLECDVTPGVNELNKQVVRETIIQTDAAVDAERAIPVTLVEQKPEFPGGEIGMYKWLAEHLSYPADAAEEGAQGRVVVQFDITKEGRIENVKVVRSVHPSLDREAMRLVKCMPKWQPGSNKGEAVKVMYTVPVTFKLQ